MKFDIAGISHRAKRWIANFITGGDLFVAEDDLKRTAQNLALMRERLEKERQKCEELSKHECPEITATAVINRILRRPITWVDKSKLDIPNRKAWSGHARSLIDNPLFQAICGKIGNTEAEDTSGELVKIIIEHIAKHSKNHEETRDLRMTINGIERVREEVASWLFNESTSSMEGLNDPL